MSELKLQQKEETNMTKGKEKQTYDIIKWDRIVLKVWINCDEKWYYFIYFRIWNIWIGLCIVIIKNIQMGASLGGPKLDNLVAGYIDRIPVLPEGVLTGE